MDRKSILKYTFCFILLIFMTFSLVGCSDKAAVSVENAGVSRGVFAYYLDCVMSSPDAYELSEAPTKTEYINAAVKLCQEHIAVSSICRENGYTLSTLEKSSVAVETENYWGMFSKYYESIGMEKQDLTIVKENEEKRALIINKLYGEDGKTPVKKSQIIKAMNSTYVGFKAITGYLTKIDSDGNEVSCSAQEKKEIRTEFKKMAEKINGGEKIESLNEEYNESQGLTGADELSVTIIDNNDTGYPEKFYSEIKKIKTGKTGVVEIDNYIFVIQRQDISSDKYIELYSRQILESLKSEDVKKIIDSRISEYGKTKKNSISDIYSAVVSARGKTK